MQSASIVELYERLNCDTWTSAFKVKKLKRVREMNSDVTNNRKLTSHTAVSNQSRIQPRRSRAAIKQVEQAIEPAIEKRFYPDHIGNLLASCQKHPIFEGSGKRDPSLFGSKVRVHAVANPENVKEESPPIQLGLLNYTFIIGFLGDDPII